eukprot:g35106.t1
MLKKLKISEVVDFRGVKNWSCIPANTRGHLWRLSGKISQERGSDTEENSTGQSLPSSVGYLIIVGLGFLFCALTLVAFHFIQPPKSPSGDEFFTAGRMVGPGLTAGVIVSQWTWAATLLQSSAVAYKYGVSGPFWYASGATIQILLFAILAVYTKRHFPSARTFLEIILARYGPTASLVYHALRSLDQPHIHRHVQFSSFHNDQPQDMNSSPQIHPGGPKKSTFSLPIGFALLTNLTFTAMLTIGFALFTNLTFTAMLTIGFALLTNLTLHRHAAYRLRFVDQPHLHRHVPLGFALLTNLTFTAMLTVGFALLTNLTFTAMLPVGFALLTNLTFTAMLTIGFALLTNLTFTAMLTIGFALLTNLIFTAMLTIGFALLANLTFTATLAYPSLA